MNEAKINKIFAKLLKTAKKIEKACFWQAFSFFNVLSFLSISLQRLLRSGKRRRKYRNQRRCQGR